VALSHTELKQSGSEVAEQDYRKCEREHVALSHTELKQSGSEVAEQDYVALYYVNLLRLMGI